MSMKLGFQICGESVNDILPFTSSLENYTSVKLYKGSDSILYCSNDTEVEFVDFTPRCLIFTSKAPFLVHNNKSECILENVRVGFTYKDLSNSTSKSRWLGSSRISIVSMLLILLSVHVIL